MQELKLIKKTIIAITIASLLAGCSSFSNKPLSRETKKYNADQTAKLNMASDQFEAAKAERTKMRQPFISGRSVPRAKHTLPQPFYMTYSIGIEKNQTLAAVAGEVTRLSGISVRISADVTTNQTMGGNNTSAVSTVTKDSWGTDAPMDYSNATLSDILNGVCARLGVDWEYDEDTGVINISRLTTRVFYVPINNSSSSQTASVGKSGSSGGSSGGATSTTSSTSTSSTNSAIDPWSGMQQLISGMLTDKGKVSVNSSMNTIVVTDVKQSVDRIGKVIAKFVKQNTASMLFKIDVIGVVNKDQNEVGVNWRMVWNQLGQVAPNANISFNGSPQFSGQTGGGIGLTLSPPVGGTAGHWDGSSLILGALNAVGKTSIVNSTFVPAMNNKLASLALTDQVNYIASSTAAGGAGGTAVGLNASTVTTGFILNMIPLLTNERDIVMQFSMDVSTLNNMDKITSAGQTLQQPNLSSTGMALTQKLKEGATTVLAGYSRMINGDEKESMLPNIMIGGGAKASQIRQDMIILVTPIMVE